MKLLRLSGDKYGAKYQTAPVAGSGVGRFQVYPTDNANARATGRRPKWTVADLYTNRRFYCETLAEVAEECERAACLGKGEK